MATLSSSSPHLMLHRFVFSRSTLPFTSLLSRPKQSVPISLKTTPFLRPSPVSTRFFTTPHATVSQELADGVTLIDNEQIQVERESQTIPSAAAAADGLMLSNLRRSQTSLPNLTVKEKKELASYAHSLGKKLKSQQVGKSGVTDTVIMALVETLEANELLKLKIHGSCPAELKEAVKQIEGATGSLAVGQIGRTVILYRPSMTKLKAEERKKQSQIDYLKKKSTSRSFYQSRKPESGSGQETRQFGRGRRGSSRY